MKRGLSLARAALRASLPLLAALAVLLLCVAAAARPGGGSSYHGSSSSHSSGGYSGGGGYSSGGGGSGGGGNAFAIAELIILCIEHPVLGLIILIIGGVIFFANAQNRGQRDWSTGGGDARPPPPPPPPQNFRSALEGLRRFDDAFSVILFEDFLYALYAQVHAARGRGALDSFSAYLAPPAIAALPRGNVTEVKTVIVGALRFTSVNASGGGPNATFSVTAEFEANYTEVGAGQERAWYVREQWQLFRRASAPSRTPDKARIFACPSCGAPLDGVTLARCRYCNKEVCNGEFDWVVSGIEVLEREARGPMLTAETEEEGTDDPTVVDPNARNAYAALTQRDPATVWSAFEARVGLVFLEFQRAWAARDLTAMRPFLSDNLFEVETYWVRAYQAQRLRNITQNARITRLELARVGTDRFFDAITVRLFASSLDYTVTDDGKHVCGSRSRERTYSEYWTFLRSTRKAGPPRADRVCPSCGAPLAINMVGVCTYCQAKITAGEFDWVLSRIEQDESYTG
jgi:hypothetical protein